MAYVTFIHGMANKPPYQALKDAWCNALSRADPARGSYPPQGNAGVDLALSGVGFDMTYWADVLYAEPSAIAQAVQEMLGLEGIVEGRLMKPLKGTARRPAPKWRGQLKSAEEKAFVAEVQAEFESRLDGYLAVNPKTKRKRKVTQESVREELRLPEFIQRPLLEELLRDVHHYFYNVESQPKGVPPKYKTRDELRQRFIKSVKAGSNVPGPHVVVSHSMGTIIAYDCLRNVEECPPIDVLFTLGSPLGLDAVQENLTPQGAKRVDFPAKVKRWVNIFDPFDPVVGFDPKFGNDFKQAGKKVVRDIEEKSWGRWRHDITKYLSGPKFRAELREALKP